MANWIWRDKKENEEGFSLVELLIVVIIMGILAAIAIPLFLSQRAKAEDKKAEALAETLGKELGTWWTDNETPPPLAIGQSPAGDLVFFIDEDSSTTVQNEEIVTGVPNGWDFGVGGTVTSLTALGKGWDFGLTASTVTGKAGWCVWIYNENGKLKGYTATATGGLQGDPTQTTTPCVTAVP
ncbi:MAG: prepilin-type N-terminal cleavage/methylation domain-containing protein [Bifidobacteriaceae bacterium]|nr:prepilin-type N-terminal cleavage/methylation domain-containing protein [Bifidobacteriaceae bacterium]